MGNSFEGTKTPEYKESEGNIGLRRAGSLARIAMAGMLAVGGSLDRIYAQQSSAQGQKQEQKIEKQQKEEKTEKFPVALLMEKQETEKILEKCFTLHREMESKIKEVKKLMEAKDTPSTKIFDALIELLKSRSTLSRTALDLMEKFSDAEVKFAQSIRHLSREEVVGFRLWNKGIFEKWKVINGAVEECEKFEWDEGRVEAEKRLQEELQKIKKKIDDIFEPKRPPPPKEKKVLA